MSFAFSPYCSYRRRQKNSFRWLCLDTLQILVYFYFSFSYLNCLCTFVILVAGYCLKLEICMTSNSYFAELRKWVCNALRHPRSIAKSGKAQHRQRLWSGSAGLLGVQYGEMPGPPNCAEDLMPKWFQGFMRCVGLGFFLTIILVTYQFYRM